MRRTFRDLSRRGRIPATDSRACPDRKLSRWTQGKLWHALSTRSPAIFLPERRALYCPPILGRGRVPVPDHAKDKCAGSASAEVANKYELLSAG